MSFLADTRIAKLRPRLSQMFWPNVALFFAVFVVSFFAGRFTEQWQNLVVWISCGTFAFLFWFLPLIRYATTYLEITTTRVVSRSGLFGQHRQEIKIADISRVELAKRRAFTIEVNGQEPLVITGIPNHKTVALEIDRLAASI
ncbi:PH domain-containing protein [Rhodoluna sp.]|jgi:uncharacterized membrane protein YdbT with pleckstrin-like domain|uniref:PH domain-containing protein n=1 Tax=Rhodoluna sp. TaxID=1969481 RepID=UPI0025EBB321|nr:PH domain-containing protein [Rhodoluna sp.]